MQETIYFQGDDTTDKRKNKMMEGGEDTQRQLQFPRH